MSRLFPSFTEIEMSAVASSSSGRVPQGEVVMEVSYDACEKGCRELRVQFADGGSYIKRGPADSFAECVAKEAS